MDTLNTEYPTWCECGCGAEINQERRQILALRHSGLTYDRCDLVMGKSRGCCKQLLARPARFIKGHAALCAVRMIRPCAACGADVVSTSTERVVTCRGATSRKGTRCEGGGRLWVEAYDQRHEMELAEMREWRARINEMTGTRAPASERDRLADQAALREIARAVWREDEPRRAAIRAELHRLQLAENAIGRAERLAFRKAHWWDPENVARRQVWLDALKARNHQRKARRVDPERAAIADPLAGEDDERSKEIARLIYEQVCEDSYRVDGDGTTRAFGLPEWLVEGDGEAGRRMGHGH